MQINKAILVLILFFSTFFNSCLQDTKNNINKPEEIILESEENDEKVAELGNYLLNAILEGNTESYISKLDINNLNNKVASNLKQGKEFKRGFKSGLSKGVKNISESIIKQIDNGSFYDFISFRYDDKTKTYSLLFRFFSSTEGINYHEYKVSKGDNELLFNDIYIYLTGEYISSTMERLALTALPKNQLLNLFGKKDRDNLNKMIKGLNLFNSGNANQAYSELESISGNLAEDKYILILKNQIASSINEKLYEKTINELFESYPNDKTLNLAFVDYYLIKEDYDKAFELIDELQSQTEDPFLKYLKGNIQFTKGDIKSAKEQYKFISENYEDFFDGHSSYMTCLIEGNEFNETVGILNKLLDLEYEKKQSHQFHVRNRPKWL